MRSEAFGSRLSTRRGEPLLAVTASRSSADPKGVAHGWAAFSDRGRMPSRKIPVHATPRAADLSGKRFSLVPFLLLASSMLAPSGPASPFALRALALTKRNELGRFSGRKRLIYACAFDFGKRSNVKRFHSPCGERVHFFCWPKRNGTKEKGQPRRSSLGESLVSGFFDSPSLARSKNAARPCAAPSGSALCIDHLLQSQSQSQSQSRSLAGCAPYGRYCAIAETCAQ
ncbi:hypothetical protein J2X52_002103 [Luteimonas sp. 3794]|nr:hypothetical protein [Luteimonas sp. 3794]